MKKYLLKFNRNEPLREQQPNQVHNRKEIDYIIFDELNVTTAERNEAHWSVVYW